MAKSPSAYSARSVVSPPPPTDIIVWPCWSAAEAKPWPSCSLVSIKPSTRRSPKTFIPTKSIPRRAIPKLFILTVHIIPSWTLRLTQTRCQHGLLRTLTDIRQFLRPDFERVVARPTVISQSESLLVALTEDQYSVLDMVSENSRRLVEGAAGTGKTVLALEY